MTTYHGRTLGSGRVLVGVDGEELVNDHAHSSGDFDWGSSSPGARDLARAILRHHLGAVPARSIAYRFAFAVVADWTESRWTLTTSEIAHALLELQRSYSVSCLLCADTGRHEVAPRLWRACACRPPVSDTAA